MTAHSRITAFICTLSAIVLISCGPPAKVGDQAKLCQPTDLKVVTVGNGRAIIAYNPGCPETRILRGFNIYVSPVPLVGKYGGRALPSSVKPHNPEIYPGDPEGTFDRETYEIKNVANATRYYVHLRTVYSDKSLSLPTNEIELVCWPQGEIDLAVSYSGKQDGFSFTLDNYCGTDDIENDMYFFHKDGFDYFCSPARLSAVNRKSKLFNVAAGTLHGDLGRLQRIGYEYKKIKIFQGERYLLETEDGHVAGLYIKRFEGEGSNRRVIFDYLFKPPIKETGSGA